MSAFLCIGLLLVGGALLVALGIVVVMTKRGSSSGSREGAGPSVAAAPPAPKSREPAFFLRLEGESADLMRASAERLAFVGILTDAITCDAVLELMRSLVNTTHT